MVEEKKSNEFLWREPEVVVINMKEYEQEIIANARSGIGGCGCNCWSVGCKIFS